MEYNFRKKKSEIQIRPLVDNFMSNYRGQFGEECSPALAKKWANRVLLKRQEEFFAGFIESWQSVDISGVEVYFMSDPESKGTKSKPGKKQDELREHHGRGTI